MTDRAHDMKPDPAFRDITDRLNRWRSIQRNLGAPVYDEPEWEDGKLYFRNGFKEGLHKWPHWKDTGDWSAYVIEPSPHGYFNVLQSLKGERDLNRRVRVQAAFRRAEDAGKYVVARVGNTLRISHGLGSIFIKWDDAGLNPRLQVADVTQEQLDYMREVCAGIRPGLLEQHLRRYFLADQPHAYALPLPSEVPLMNVIPLTFDDLDAVLTDGMPRDAISI